MKLIKIITALAITAAAVVSGTYAFAAENILQNGDFETELIGEGNWRFSETGRWYTESENPIECVNGASHNGSRTLHFNSALVAQRVRLHRNTTYTLEFYIKAGDECVIDAGLFDGSQDWPASYPFAAEKISVGTEWKKASIELECTNTQDYLVYFSLWDKIDVYIDDVVLKESDSYISRLMTGVDGEGAISYSADFKGGEFFGTALYNENNVLTGFIPAAGNGTFNTVDAHGKYMVRSYLMDDSGLRSKSQEIEYNENSAENESKAVGRLKELKLSNNSITMSIDDKTKTLDALLMPEFAYNNAVAWESSDSSVVAVSDNGALTPKGEGTAVITAKSEDGLLSDSCTVTVTANIGVSGVSLSETNILLKEADAVYPLHAQSALKNDELVWSSDNEAAAIVTNGVVTAKGNGEAKITVSTADGKYSAECSVKVDLLDNTITNDTFYKDTDGNYIYSQGGCICKFNGKYYWYGIKYAEAPIYAQNPQNGKAGNASYEAFTCYLSDDLVNWKFEGYPFTEKPDGWVGRMGVAYNENTKKYVLISQYAPGMVFAVSDKPQGPFKIDHILEKLPIENGMTGDQTIFQDDDGKAYIICSSTNGRAYQYIIPLRESDFLDIDADNIKMIFYDEDGSYTDENGHIAQKDKTGIEGNCMFKYNGNYYFTGSDLYGWNSSRVYVLQAEDILGDYNRQIGLPYIMEGTADSFAHNSQAGFYVTVHGSENDLVIYCGDRWSDFAGNGIGYNQWIPLSFDDGKPYFNNVHQWRLDAEKGTWEIGGGNNYIANPEFEADRKETNSIAGWTTRDNVGGYANSNFRGKIDSGNFVMQQSAPEDYIAEMSQTIRNLPDGTYTMTAWVKSSGGQNVCSLYAESSGDKKMYSVKMPLDEWTEVIVASDIKVKDGQCTIGLYSDAHADEWVQIDNLRLVKNTEQ